MGIVSNMLKFRKKPIVIEAFQFTHANKDRVFNWITCSRYPDFDAEGNPTLRIQTLEGEMTASLDDWIIKGVNGEFYPCKPDIFEKSYESAEGNRCGICGGVTTEIRGRHPKDDKRNVCPTCCAERLDQINEISSRHYGVAMSAKG